MQYELEQELHPPEDGKDTHPLPQVDDLHVFTHAFEPPPHCAELELVAKLLHTPIHVLVHIP